METITSNKAMEYAKQLIQDKRITRQEASEYIMKNYHVVSSRGNGKVLTSRYAISTKLAREFPMTRKERSQSASNTNVRRNAGNVCVAKVTRKRRNMDAHNLRRDIRGVLTMNLSDNVKLLIIKEMTA
jgi:hypothetical protein